MHDTDRHKVPSSTTFLRMAWLRRRPRGLLCSRALTIDMYLEWAYVHTYASRYVYVDYVRASISLAQAGSGQSPFSVTACTYHTDVYLDMYVCTLCSPSAYLFSSCSPCMHACMYVRRGRWGRYCRACVRACVCGWRDETRRNDDAHPIALLCFFCVCFFALNAVGRFCHWPASAMGEANGSEKGVGG